MPTNGQTLLVVGAGPKALAIASKRAVLDRLGFSVPELVVVDRTGVAADWSGEFGFTDGSPSLGTRPEKDVGFPYNSQLWGDMGSAVNHEMTDYSWQRYLIDTGVYSAWIDRARPQPNHQTWSQYLGWVADRVQLGVRVEEIRAMSIHDDRWCVSCAHPRGEMVIEGDGLVVTGPGTPIRIAGQPHDHPRVTDGNTFWTRLDRFTCLSYPVSVGVIGSGETAAAIVVALIEALHPDSAIEIVSSQGLPYTRGESYEESRLFSDPGSEWHYLTEHHRREFVRRTDRGVFSVRAQRRIDRADNIRSLAGQVVRVHAGDEHVLLDIRYGDEMERVAYDYVVVAIGFDPLTFTRWFDPETSRRFTGATGHWQQTAVERAIGPDLALEGCRPRLHLPMLAGVAQGPGFPNLSCLGLLSDRVLFPYVHPPGGRAATAAAYAWATGETR